MSQEIYLTVKEWKEKVGIDLYNYDGFKDDYKKIVCKDSIPFSDEVIVRFNDAGNLICNRRYFESKLESCSMYFPEEKDYEKMIEFIPNYIESQIMISIYYINHKLKSKYDKKRDRNFLKKIPEFLNKKLYAIDEEDKKELQHLICLLELQKKAKEKSIYFAQIKDLLDNIILEKGDFLKSQKLDKYIGKTENEIHTMLITILSNLLKKGNDVKFSDTPFDLLEALDILHKKRVRITNRQTKESIGELYCFRKNNDSNKFVRTFSEIDKNGFNHGVVFQFTDDNNNEIKGSLPISEERKNSIDSSYGTKK